MSEDIFGCPSSVGAAPGTQCWSRGCRSTPTARGQMLHGVEVTGTGQQIDGRTGRRGRAPHPLQPLPQANGDTPVVAYGASAMGPRAASMLSSLGGETSQPGVAWLLSCPLPFVLHVSNQVRDMSQKPGTPPHPHPSPVHKGRENAGESENCHRPSGKVCNILSATRLLRWAGPLSCRAGTRELRQDAGGGQRAHRSEGRRDLSGCPWTAGETGRPVAAALRVVPEHPRLAVGSHLALARPLLLGREQAARAASRWPAL